MLNLNPENKQDIFDQIRAGYEFVAARAEHVRINHGNIKPYALSIPLVQPSSTYDDDHHYLGDNAEDTASYILTAESMNLGGGCVDALAAEGFTIADNSIYYTVTSALKRYYETEAPLTARQLQEMRIEQCAAIFNFDIQKDAQRRIAAQFLYCMNILGGHIQDVYAGSFMNFIESGHNSCRQMLENLAQMEYYKDIHQYKSVSIPIYKRAQHSVAVINLGMKKLGLDVLPNMHRLTMFADNAVPHVLRTDGILEYSEALAAKIENGEELPSGSPEEIEIRCCAGHAVELMAAAKGVNACDIDFNLWHHSVEDPRYSLKPTHITRSIYY